MILTVKGFSIVNEAEVNVFLEFPCFLCDPNIIHKQGWAPRNWCFWTLVLEKTLETPLDCKEIKPVNPKGNKFWIFIGRTDAEAEAPVLFGHLMQRANSSLEKTLMLGKIKSRRRRGWQRTRWSDGITESMDMSFSKLREMVKDRKAWRAAVHGGHKESVMTELLNHSNKIKLENFWNYGSGSWVPYNFFWGM